MQLSRIVSQSSPIQAVSTPRAPNRHSMPKARPMATGCPHVSQAPKSAMSPLQAPSTQTRAIPERTPSLKGPSAPTPDNESVREALWQNILSTRYAPPSVQDAPMGRSLSALLALFRMRFDGGYRDSTIFKPFTDTADVRPDRQKLFHTYGTAAKATFVPQHDTPYTGVFKSGALCLVRLSLASNDQDYAPGVAVKFFIEGQDSANVVALPGLDGQTAGGKPDRNFFAHEPTTWFPAAVGKAKILENTLQTVSEPRGINPRRVATEGMAAHTADGSQVSTPSCPERIIFRHAKHQFAADTAKDFRTELAETFHPGDTLYEVWDDKRKLGSLRLDSEFVTSEFGDRGLHFHHHP